MLGFRLQIFGQYQGLLRNFCDRSQSVSPFWITYSSGAPGTGWTLASGGGRGLCSVTTGAVSPFAGAGFFDAGGCSAGWACVSTGGWTWGCSCVAGCFSCCARATGAPSDARNVPAKAALRHRAIVLIRMKPPELQVLEQQERPRRLARSGVPALQLLNSDLLF